MIDGLPKRIKRWIGRCGVGIALPLHLYAQQQAISFEHINTDDGLSAPVQEILEDPYGFIWLGTTDGLNRFDGKNFVVYRNEAGNPGSLANNIINGLCLDQHGRVWAATNGGLCYYDFADDAFHPVAFPDSLEQIDRYRVHAITTDPQGDIWFATRTHVHHWHDGHLAGNIALSAIPNVVILSLYKGEDDLLWIGSNVGIHAYDLRAEKFLYNAALSPFSKEKNLSASVHPIRPWSGDTLLIGSWYGGLQKIITDGTTIRNFPCPDPAGNDPRKHIIKGIWPAGDGKYWVGSYGNGLSLFDARTESFEAHYHHDPADRKSLSVDFINDVHVDGSGILWVGTDAGLDKYDPFTQQFQSIPLPSVAGEFSVYKTPSAFLEDAHDPASFWMSVSGAGIYHFDHASGTFTHSSYHTTKPGSLPDNTVYALYRDRQGRQWVGMKSGLYLADDAFQHFSVPPSLAASGLTSIHILLQDPDGSFWLGSYAAGVYHWNERTGELQQYRHEEDNPQSLPDNRVFCMLQDHAGHLWIGTQNRGLCRLEKATGTFRYFEYNRNATGTIPDNGIYDLHEDTQHHLWIATENGLAEMRLDDFSVTVYTTQDGLCNNDVFSITPDHAGDYWLATNNGLSKMDPRSKKFKNYYIADGLPVNRLSGAVYLNRLGTLYLGTSGMISYCQPSRMQINKRVPPVVITHFRVFDEPQPIQRRGSDLEPIRLSYRQNMITFDFAALNFTNSALNQYAYRLVGFDDHWIFCGNKQTATFTNLDGGTYTFQVKAANNDGVWNEQGANVTIFVQSPFWKTGWFFIGLFLLAAGILYAAYRFRVQQLVKLQQIRMRISRDLHDDIGSTLSSINMISTMAHERNPPESKARELFSTISSASNQAMDLMNDIVWSINPKNDRMEMILIRMRQYASEILEAAGIAFTLEMDDACRHLSLPIEKRKDFYLIFKEAINNLAKYAKASEAGIALSYAHRTLRMVIRDNGTGFDTTVSHSGNGLKNMRARAGQLKGALSIVSKPGQGTQIELKIPVLP